MPVIEDGRLPVAATLHLEPTPDARLWRVKVSGRMAGSVRLTDHGWLPLGGFVFAAMVTPVYYESKEGAAIALGRAVLRRAKKERER